MAELGFWNLAQASPEKLALVDPMGREWTRGELLAEANQIAHGLRSLGLEPGDCVAVVMENCAEFFQINLAIMQLGMYMTPINNHLTGLRDRLCRRRTAARKVFFGSGSASLRLVRRRHERKLDFP